MALGKIQQQIVAKLEEMSRLSSAQQETILATPGDLTGTALDKLLQEEYRITDFQLLVARARAHGMAPYNVQRYQVGPTTFERIPEDFCQQNLALPVGQVGEYLLVAFANPFEVTVATKIHEMTGKKVLRLLGREKEIREKFNRSQQVEAQFTDVVEQLGAEFGVGEDIKDEDLANEESGPIIDLANRIIEDAYFAGTSDIHVEPWEKELIVRYRIDGLCQEKLRLPGKVAGALVARFKIMSNLDIAERRLPQDGRIIFKQFTKKSIDIDLRVSTAPLNFGEGMVLRILDKQKSTLPLAALGFTEANLAVYRRVIRQPYGMILHCGPTGSGKSTTLYAMLSMLNDPGRKLVTIEDPIEYIYQDKMAIISQREVGIDTDSFQEALRRQPDFPEAHNNLGNALAQLPGRLNDAIAHYETALRQRPDYAEAHNNLGNALAPLPGRLKDALTHYEAALRLKPDFAGAHNNLGLAWSRMPGRLNDAVAEYQAALHLRPDYAAAHNNLGLAW